MHNISFWKKGVLRKIGGEPWQKVGVGHFFFLIHITFSRNEALVKPAT